MEIENKLDEDFLFYLGFSNSFLHRLKNKADVERARAWLQKLCGEPYAGVDQKRCRNIYLSNLVLCMQDGALQPQFLHPPNEVNVADAQKVFGPVQPDIVKPDWLNDILNDADDDGSPARDDGRTYLATRTLPNGQGAFAYLAVTLAEDEPKWLGGGEGVLDERLAEKYAEYVPPVTEMEQILARRKNPAERERVLTFYDTLMRNIADEIDGNVLPNENETVNELLSQLVNDLVQKGRYENYENLSENERRVELLLILHDRIFARRRKVAKREEVLDDIEENFKASQSFFDDSVLPEEKYELPAAMWEQAINKAPFKKNMTLLQGEYPGVLIEKLLELLSNEKEEIAIRMQKRHDNIVSQLKKELKREAEKQQRLVGEAKTGCDQAMAVLADVVEAYKKQYESEVTLQKQKEHAVPEQRKVYEQLRQVLFDTQKSVEDEAKRGRHLASQINSVNEQNAMYQDVNDTSIAKAEEANIALMKNIKKLRGAIRIHEAQLEHLKAIARASVVASKQQQFFMV